MKKSDYRTMRWLLLLAVMLLLNACSDTDAPGDQKKERVQLELKPYASSYFEEQETEGIRTRDGWTPPSPYVIYDNLNAKFKDQKDLMKKSITVFFTNDGADPMEGTFFYRNSDSKWQLSMDIDNSGDYYLYGFIPKEDATSATIASASSGKYSDGAVLAINGLQTVTPSDVCVLIGAKEGSSETSDETIVGEDHLRLRPGAFKTNIQSTGVSGNHNYVYLLFDHLYASLRFRFKVDEKYAALRTIRLKKLELISYSSGSGGEVYAKFDVRITLRKTDDGSSPIVNIVYTPDESSTSVPPTPIFEGEVKLLTSATTDFMGCFVPGDNTYFKLRSTYDVYDNNTNLNPKGNLIREECQAENTIDLRKWFGNDLKTTRGHSYALTMTVQPTYLYMLSDPDLNNPTVTIN